MLIFVFLVLNLLIVVLAVKKVGVKIIWDTPQSIEQLQANEVEPQFYVQ